MKTKKEIYFDEVNKRIVTIRTLVKSKTVRINNKFCDYYEYKPEILVKKDNITSITRKLLFKRTI